MDDSDGCFLALMFVLAAGVSALVGGCQYGASAGRRSVLLAIDPDMTEGELIDAENAIKEGEWTLDRHDIAQQPED